MAAQRVALATCAEVPELDEDGPPLLAALAARGLEGVPAVWDEGGVDWPSFELVVLRSTWDYAERRAEFLTWVESLPRVLNAPDVVRWNTDKRYLADLAAAGVPVVPTTFVAPGEPVELPSTAFVVKPAVSAGSRRSASYEAGDAERALAHVRALHDAGDTAMVQPYVEAIDALGETALLYAGGEYSHAVRKEALLPPGAPLAEGLYLEETIEAREPSDAEREVGARALAAVPRGDELLYARVDLVPGEDGPLLLELELTEPSLFLGYSPGAALRLAEAIDRALGSRA